MAMTPSQYLKLVRQDFQHLPADICDMELENAEKSASGLAAFDIPSYIPAKYHARMQATWKVMLFGILFVNATRKYSLIQRHKLLQKSL